jgi:type IV secretion system protein VirB4
VGLHRVDRSSLAAVLPWGQLIRAGKQAKVALRGKGMMRGWKMEGLSLEGSAPHEAEAHARQFSRAIATHLGTNDMLHYIAHRRPAMAYPVRVFPSLAARMLDAERARHVAEQSYWQTEHLLFGSTQREAAVQEGVKASFFAPRGTTLQRSFEAWDKATDERWAAFADACGLRLEALGPEPMFRTLIRSASGRDIPAVVPRAGARLNEIVGTDYWYGGVAPQMGDLHMSAATVVGYPVRTMPQIMQTVLRHSGQLTLSARFIGQDPQDTHAQLQLERTYQVRAGLGSIVDIAAKVLNIPRRATLNQDIERQIAEIDSALTASAAGMAFGWCTIVSWSGTWILKTPKCVGARSSGT